MTFVHEREVPQAWRDDLASISPRTDRINFLHLVWEPGISYAPVQRWEIRECIPLLEFVPPDIVASLEGPDPRTIGEWVADANVPEHLGGKSWLTDSLVSRSQWLVYRETGCYSQRFWIIQGDAGGHKWQLSQAERNHMKALLGADADTPNPGSLPYAEYDGRVQAKMIEYDKLRKWRMSLDWDQRQVTKTRAGLYVRNDRRAMEEMYGRAMVQWLETQVGDLVNDIPRRLLPGMSDLASAHAQGAELARTAPKDVAIGHETEDEITQQLIHDGATAPER